MAIGAESTPEGRLYGVLAEALSFPTGELAAVAASGALAGVLEEVLRCLPWAPPEFALAEGRHEGLSLVDLEAAYISLFDTPDRIPTPLYSGVYAPRRRDAMEELLRTYRRFGVTVKADSHDLPDSIPTVLEFLSLLADGLRSSSAEGKEARERALAEVLERHLCPWATATRERLAKREALAFYQQLVATVDVLTHARMRHLRSTMPPAITG